MTVNRTQTSPQINASELIDRLGRFDGPPEQFIVNLLAVQCHIAQAAGGTILRPSRDGGIEMVATYPPLAEGQAAPVWLAQAAEAAPGALQDAQSTVRPVHDAEDLYGAAARRNLVLIPLRGGQGIRGVSAFLMETGDQRQLTRAAERLELTTSLLSLYEMRLTLQHRQRDLQRLRTSMETLAAVNDNRKFTGAAMAFCNEVNTRWQANRVSLGILKSRYVKLKAMSDTEKFDRKTEPVQKIESAMEESLDQDVEVLYPSGEEATFVSRAAKELSNRYGPSTVLSLPLRHEGEPVGVVTVERPNDKPFELAEAEALRLTCDLCSARLISLHETDRWFGAKAAHTLARGAGAVVGPKHTWIKLLGIGLAALVVFLVFARGDWDAESDFVIEASERRSVVAPFESRLEEAFVQPNDTVARGQVLAELDTFHLERERNTLLAKLNGALQQETAARRAGKPAEAQIYASEARALRVQIEQIDEELDRAKIASPIDGIVLRGEPKRMLGKPMEKGDVLLEVGPLDALRAELSVPEDVISDLLDAKRRAEQSGEQLRGELATRGHPDRKIGFVVERVNPTAEVVENENVFKVRVRLEEIPPSLRPGTEGVAHVKLGTKPYAWLWTRKLINWVRMKLWI